MLSSGNPSAPIWIIGEAPGPNDIEGPFTGSSGFELTKMLNEAKINRQHCFMGNVADKLQTEYKLKATAAKELGIVRVDGLYPTPNAEAGRARIRSLIHEHNPSLVIALGNLALWAITGKIGITKWRGSILPLPQNRGKCVPTFNPAGVMKNWAWRWISVQDFRRAKKESTFEGIHKPKWEFIIQPNLDTTLGFLKELNGVVATDIETRGNQISCVGIATSKLHAISIPFMSIENPEGYWSKADEYLVTLAMRDALCRPGVGSIFHNGLFDVQYFCKQWGYAPTVEADTMLMQHAAFSGLRKSLDFISSLYCEYYCYWKEDGKLWNPKTHSENQHWIYNCTDCTYTYENWEELKLVLGKLDLVE